MNMTSLFGVAFFLYYLKLISGNNGFWSTLRNTEPSVHRVTTRYQRFYRKARKAEQDIKFLLSCRVNRVFPKFIKWRNLESKHPRLRAKNTISDFSARLFRNDDKN